MKTYLHSKHFLWLLMPLVICMESCQSKPNLEELICVTINTPSHRSVYFFTDTLGNMITKPETGVCYDFHDGLACILKKGKYGYMNGQGKIVIPLLYDKAGDFTNGFAIVHNEKQRAGLINTKGEEIMPCEYTYIGTTDKHGRRWVRDSTEALGIFSEEGEEIIPCKYKEIVFLKNGSIYFNTLDHWKYICTPQNDTIRLDQYWEVKFQNDSLAIVRYSNSYGVIDLNGNEIIPCTIKDLHFNKEGWMLYAKDNKKGWLHISGKEILMDIYGRALFQEGMASVENKKEIWGYVNTDGHVVIPYQYAAVRRFSEGLAAVRLLGENLFGYINKKGEMVIPPRYSSANEFCNGVAYVTDRNGNGLYINREGTELDTVYLSAKITVSTNYLQDLESVSEWVKGRDKNRSSVGCRTKDGKIIIPCQYATVKKHPHWIEAISSDEKHYIYSPEGHFYFKY